MASGGVKERGRGAEGEPNGRKAKKKKKRSEKKNKRWSCGGKRKMREKINIKQNKAFVV